MEDVTTRLRRVSGRASQAPFTASASASVPEAVKTTSRGSQPNSRATRVRAPSKRARAARPVACTLLGLQGAEEAKDAARSAATSGASGVLALWSR